MEQLQSAFHQTGAVPETVVRLNLKLGEIMRLMTKRFFGHFALMLALSLFAWVPFATAQVPMAKKQVPGFYRMMVGQFEVTALFDGAFEMDVGLMMNATVPEMQEMLARRYIDGDKVQTAINAYLVNTGQNLVLIDVGCGILFGPERGRLFDNLKESGYTPEQVDTILLSHMHPDHLGGLVDADGKIRFPNAKIYAHKLESEYWLSEKRAAEAPDDTVRGRFKAAQDSTAPYRKAGRWHTFDHRDEVVPGIRAVSTAGHTPGHTTFRINSDEERFFVLGDLVHSYAIQFARPDIAIAFDVDPKQAVLTRYKVFNLAVKYKWLVAGQHLPYPGIGHIGSNGDGTYTWLPIQKQPQ